MVYYKIICVCVVCLRQVPELAFPRLRVKVQGPFKGPLTAVNHVTNENSEIEKMIQDGI